MKIEPDCILMKIENPKKNVHFTRGVALHVCMNCSGCFKKFIVQCTNNEDILCPN